MVLHAGVHRVVEQDPRAQLRDAVQVDHTPEGQHHYSHRAQRAGTLAGAPQHAIRCICILEVSCMSHMFHHTARQPFHQTSGAHLALIPA